jgi:uncharacterized protein YbjT (DUF2867 family)
MRIAVVSANSHTGRLLLPRLTEAGCETVALVRAPVEFPADTVVHDWLSSPETHRVLEDVDAIVPLSGDLRPLRKDGFDAAHVRTSEIVAGALRRGRARRAVYLSYVGADETSTNPYLRTKAIAERLLRESGKEVVVFRCTAMLDTPESPGPFELAFTAPQGAAVRLVGNGRQRERPIYRGDVVQAILAALQGGRPGTYELAGPEEMSADDFIRLVNRRDGVRIAHVPPWIARLLSLGVPGLNPALIDLLRSDSTGDPGPAVAEFGLTLTPLTRIWKRP